jgi:opacity protein-like surface antigen
MSFGLMGTFQARKKRFVSITDTMLIKMAAERNTPGGTSASARIDTNVFIFDPEAGIRVLDGDAGSLDMLGGIRIWSVENTLDVSAGTLPGFNVRERKTWFAPLIAFHGVLNTSERTFLSGKFDIGAGSGTDITTQVYAGGGFRFTRHVAVVGGYRYLKVEHDDTSGFIFNTEMNGFVAGAKFSF